MRTVSDEMSNSERREELIKGLSATGEDKVFVDVSHVIQAIGLVETEKHIESLVEQQEVENPRAFTPRSALRFAVRRRGIAQVNRSAVLKACKEARAKENKDKIDSYLKKQ